MSLYRMVNLSLIKMASQTQQITVGCLSPHRIFLSALLIFISSSHLLWPLRCHLEMYYALVCKFKVSFEPVFVPFKLRLTLLWHNIL